MEAVNVPLNPADRSRHIEGAGTTAAAWQADPALAGVPAVTLAQLIRPDARVVLVAPHPDDEILSAGGLLALLAAGNDSLLIVAVTDGEGSHPDSPAWPVDALRATRPRETLAALAELGLAAPDVLRLGIADGGVTAAESELERRLGDVLNPGDVVITTWRYDGHPDHEATARACARAAARHGAGMLEVPVWGWHWSAPGDGALPLARARKLMLAPEVVARKRAALSHFHSQVAPDASTGAGPILPSTAMERLLQPYELYVDVFDAFQ